MFQWSSLLHILTTPHANLRCCDTVHGTEFLARLCLCHATILPSATSIMRESECLFQPAQDGTPTPDCSPLDTGEWKDLVHYHQHAFARCPKRLFSEMTAKESFRACLSDVVVTDLLMDVERFVELVEENASRVAAHAHNSFRTFPTNAHMFRFPQRAP